MSWDVLIGLLVGGLMASLLVFPATWTVAARTYRCVPCADGRPISLVD